MKVPISQSILRGKRTIQLLSLCRSLFIINPQNETVSYSESRLSPLGLVGNAKTELNISIIRLLF